MIFLANRPEVLLTKIYDVAGQSSHGVASPALQKSDCKMSHQNDLQLALKEYTVNSIVYEILCFELHYVFYNIFNIVYKCISPVNHSII